MKAGVAVLCEVLWRLQSIQNAEAGDGHWEMRPHLTSSTPVALASSADGATLVHQALARHAPSYLADDCCLVTDARPRRLLSDETRTLIVMCARTNFGDTTVSAAGPQVWNYVPTDLRKPDLSYSRFRQTLKTFLVSGTKAQRDPLKMRFRNSTTYLLTYLLTCVTHK